MKVPQRQKYRKRLGRGTGSGHGKTAGKGHKGQRARSGNSKPRVGFEGGQTPIYRRLPKFGFINPFPTSYQVINLERLQKISKNIKGEITPQALYDRGFLKKADASVKILGSGELTVSLHIKAHRFSASAQSKIEKAGGKAELITP